MESISLRTQRVREKEWLAPRSPVNIFCELMRLLGVVRFILSCLLTVPLFAEHVPSEVRYVNGVEDSEKNATANMFKEESLQAHELRFVSSGKVSLNDQSKLEKMFCEVCQFQ